MLNKFVKTSGKSQNENVPAVDSNNAGISASRKNVAD